jgi:uncharacterized SAM-binding protein YcdF (DUF218 family)
MRWFPILFALKKIVSYWLMPLPLCLILLAAGWWCGRAGRRGRPWRGLLSAGLLLLLLSGNRAVSTLLVRPLESRYAAIPEMAAGEPPPAALAACRYVVVLGSGNGDMQGVSALGRLSPSGLARISEAVRLLRVLPDARLILSGSGTGGGPTHAAVLAAAVSSLGADPGRIRLVETARDTDDEAIAVKAIVGREPVALVTSAWHMPRAEGLFLRAGVDALPCPADYTARESAAFQWSYLGWDIDSLERSTCAVHEDLGLLWNWIRNRIR